MSRKYKMAAVAGLVVLMSAVLFAGQALAQRGTPVPGGMMGANRGMMGGASGMMSRGTTTSTTSITPTTPGWNTMADMMSRMMGYSAGVTGTLPYGLQGMMGMMGSGTLGNGMMGMMSNGMMPMMGGWSDPNARPLTLDQAQAAVLKYIQNLPNNAGANLAPVEVMEFANGFYVAVGDKTDGTGAFEVLVDRYSGNVSPEPGPNMMWNTKYGMMTGQLGGPQGGMMGMMGLWTPPTGAPAVSEQQARANAQKFLDTKFPGAKLPEDVMAFPGYYTIDFEVNGQPAGMLSVNAYTAQVWYHTWHGQFLSERTS
jgi:hypothetical protein